jgi:hypothetical protein
MTAHSALSPDRFTDKFEGDKHLRRDFAKLCGAGMNVTVSSPDIRAFKKCIQGDGRPGEFVSRGKQRHLTGHCHGRGYGVNQTA